MGRDMGTRRSFPIPAVLSFLAVVALARAACVEFRAFLPFPPELLAAALFLYVPLLHYRRGNPPPWIRLGGAGKSAVAGIALAAAGTLAYALFARLPLPDSLAPPAGGDPRAVLGMVPQAILAAVPEEVFFRGYLYDAFEEKGWEPVLPTSFLFALGHVAVDASWYRALTFLPGILLGAARRLAGNIHVPVLLHLLFNLLPRLAGARR